MSDLSDVIRTEIEAHGPLGFDRYMELCLYHPELGYYSRGPERSGRRGDYVTSPELDPGFGRLWAGAFESVWTSAGRPKSFTVVEIGPGEAGFAASVAAAVKGEFAAALDYVLVEPLPLLQARQRERLEGDRFRWSPGIETLEPVGAGVVFANEILDNLPVALVEGTQEGPLEVSISWEGEPVEVMAPPRPHVLTLVERFGIGPAIGSRAEVPVAAGSLVTSAARAIEKGAVVFIDYGDSTLQLLERPGGTLLCYSERGADADVLDSPGEKDITAHANWDVVSRVLSDSGMTSSGLRLQRDVLRDLGAASLFDELKEAERTASAAGEGRVALRAISRRSASVGPNRGAWARITGRDDRNARHTAHPVDRALGDPRLRQDCEGARLPLLGERFAAVPLETVRKLVGQDRAPEPAQRWRLGPVSEFESLLLNDQVALDRDRIEQDVTTPSRSFVIDVALKGRVCEMPVLGDAGRALAGLDLDHV